VLGDIPRTDDPRVLVDYRTGDDAGVYAWSGGPALVQTVDFFTPVVDDPYSYGQIAAANALSDVYAMGGEPRTALAIAALPKDGPGAEVVKAIFRGGHDKLREAGVVLLGGHTVTDTEIKFGYAITGEIDPAASAEGCYGEAFSATELLAVIDRYRAEVGIVTLAPEMPNGIDLTRRLVRDSFRRFGMFGRGGTRGGKGEKQERITHTVM